jgi:putative ABC transport system permease protein
MIPLAYNVRSLFVRKTTTFATALGIALVVFVFASVLMLSAGIKRTLGRSGSSDVAIVLRDGSDAELASSLEIPSAGLIANAREVRRRADGQPDSVAEIVAVLAMDKTGGEGVSNVQIRGVSDDALRFRPTVRITQGRAPRPGADEAMIGTALRGRFNGIDLGQSFEIKRGRRVQVVGVFEDGGSSFQSEVWCDIETVRTAFGREGLVSSVRVRLASEGDFDAFKREIESNRQLGVEVFRETRYYADQSQGTSKFVTVLGIVIAVFFSIGAMIGAMITMYSSIANRGREIGTLRALGFTRKQILSSFLFESILLAVIGGIVGAAASLLMGFVKIGILNFASWSEIVFEFTPTPQIIGSALVFATAMGLIGGLFPAVRAARVRVLDALRA